MLQVCCVMWDARKLIKGKGSHEKADHCQLEVEAGAGLQGATPESAVLRLFRWLLLHIRMSKRHDIRMQHQHGKHKGEL